MSKKKLKRVWVDEAQMDAEHWRAVQKILAAMDADPKGRPMMLTSYPQKPLSNWFKPMKADK